MSDQLSELEEFRALDEKRQFEILSDEEEARWEELRAKLSEELAAATQVKAAPEPIELDIDLSASPDEPVALASNAEFVRAEGSPESDDRGVSVDEVPAVELEVETGDLNQLTGTWTADGGDAPPEDAGPAPEPIELEVSGDADEPVQLASGAEFLDNPELVNSGEQGWRQQEGGEAPAADDDNKTMFSLGPVEGEEEESEEIELEGTPPAADDDNKTMFSLGPVEGEEEESQDIELEGSAPAADDDNKTLFALGTAEQAQEESVEVDAGEPGADATRVTDLPAEDENRTLFSPGPSEVEVEAEAEAEFEVEAEAEAEVDPVAEAPADDENKTMFSLGPVDEAPIELEAEAPAEPAVDATRMEPAPDDENKTMFSLGPVEEPATDDLPELAAEAPDLEPLPEPVEAFAAGGTAVTPMPANAEAAEPLPALDGLGTELPPLDEPLETGADLLAAGLEAPLDASLPETVPLETLAESLPPMEPVADAPAAVAAGELSPGMLPGDHPVVLQMLDGSVKRGALRDANLTAESVFMVDANGGEEALYTADLKLIVFLVRPGEPRPELRGEYCTVTFMDGRQLGGFTDEDIENAEPGFSLLPPSPQTDAARLYVFRNGLSGVARG